MPDTQDGGYILDDSGLKPYSVDYEDDRKNKFIHGPKLVHKKIGGCYLFSFNSVLSSLLLSFICPSPIMQSIHLLSFLVFRLIYHLLKTSCLNITLSVYQQNSIFNKSIHKSIHLLILLPHFS